MIVRERKDNNGWLITRYRNLLRVYVYKYTFGCGEEIQGPMDHCSTEQTENCQDILALFISRLRRRIAVLELGGGLLI